MSCFCICLAIGARADFKLWRAAARLLLVKFDQKLMKVVSWDMRNPNQANFWGLRCYCAQNARACARAHLRAKISKMLQIGWNVCTKNLGWSWVFWNFDARVRARHDALKCFIVICKKILTWSVRPPILIRKSVLVQKIWSIMWIFQKITKWRINDVMNDWS